MSCVIENVQLCVSLGSQMPSIRNGVTSISFRTMHMRRNLLDCFHFFSIVLYPWDEQKCTTIKTTIIALSQACTLVTSLKFSQQATHDTTTLFTSNFLENHLSVSKPYLLKPRHQFLTDYGTTLRVYLNCIAIGVQN